MRWMMGKLKLTVNEDKTRMRRLPGEDFDFLGYTIGQWHSPQTGRTHIGTRPSKKRVRQAMAKVSKLTSGQTTWMATVDVVRRLNRLLVGWGNYLHLGPVTRQPSHRRPRPTSAPPVAVPQHKMGGQGTTRFPDEFLISDLGLVSLSATTRNLP